MKFSYLFGLLLFALLSLPSCNKDDDGSQAGCNSIAFNERFADEVTNVSNASAAYSMDPSSTNCQNFKNAYNAYIDALETYEACAITLNQTVEWNQALDGARTSVNSIVC